MSQPLEDIRVGDIMLCPRCVEDDDGDATTPVVSMQSMFARMGCGCAALLTDLRNPEFRVGDKVRIRSRPDGHMFSWEDGMTASGFALVERAPVSDTVKHKQHKKADFIIEAWKQWPEHKDDGSCTAAGCGVCAIDKAEDTVPDNKPFVKHDESKPRMDLLPPLALKAMARVLTLGAAKYSDHNWRNIPREERGRLVASLLRHVTAAMAGEDNDAESGASHWAHAMANAAFLCELFELDKIAEDKFRR